MKIIINANKRMKKTAVSLILLCVLLITSFILDSTLYSGAALYTSADGKKFIRWVDFNVTCTVMKQAIKYDIESQSQKIKLSFIDLLSIAACKTGGKFSDKKSDAVDAAAKQLQNGSKPKDIAQSSYFDYYKQAYEAVLGGMVGKFKEEVYDETAPDKKIVKESYGIKAYSPIAYGYSYSHSEDFGNSRSFGYQRTHQGNDLMGSVGTPLVAVEDGIVECMGWNKYGGWRIGIRSLDYKRYYYYAHMRKNHPYVNTLKEGMEVKAGDVIGYLGMTGYSDSEDHNGMNVPHLHFGIQLIFDESQKDGNGEIWVDAYDIVNLLQSHRSAVYKDESTDDYVRKYKSFAVS